MALNRLDTALAAALPQELRPAGLDTARKVATALMGLLLPVCERLEIAGSIRREKPQVSDIELVAIPRTRSEAIVEAPRERPQASLFAAPAPPITPPSRLVNCLWERIEEISEGRARIVPIKPGAPTLEPDGRWNEKRESGSRYFRLFLPRPALKVDLFLADAETWGAVFTIRTGSADFSRALVTRWTAVSGGGHFQNGRLYRADGAPVPTAEERDVFEACRARFISPRDRREASSLVPKEAGR
jgi:DNA polymerase/3'-5' exonuclease PolX